MKRRGCEDRSRRVIDETFDLHSSEWLLLWGLRFWAACCRRDSCPWPLLGDVFRRNSAESAAVSLDALLHLTSLTSLRPLDVRCPACPRLSSDERSILSAVYSAQKGSKATAAKILRTWLPPSASRMALRMLVDLAGVLADAGHHLPDRAGSFTIDDSAPVAADRSHFPTVH